MSNTSEDWFADIANGDSVNQAASRIGIWQTTLARQLREDKLTPESAVALARAYKVSPLDGLVAIGLITRDEVREMAAAGSLGQATDGDLVAEVLRRLKDGGSHQELLEPLD